jgi:hypothetical protein
MLYTNNEVAGDGIVTTSVVESNDTRGIKRPFDVLLTSSIAELSAAAPVVLIDTPFCEKACLAVRQAKFITITFATKKIDNFFIDFIVYCNLLTRY